MGSNELGCNVVEAEASSKAIVVRILRKQVEGRMLGCLSSPRIRLQPACKNKELHQNHVDSDGQVW